MKIKIFYSFSLLLWMSSVWSQGIEFAQVSLADALLQAKEENKLVFVDAYTSWCGPCKKMSRSVFPNKEVGDYYNKNFVNLKINMEKGEGPSVAQRYGVRSYPTLLYLDPSGEIVHRVSGFRPASHFINVGKTAYSPAKKMERVKRKYEADGGAQNPDVVYEYAMVLKELNDSKAADMAEQYYALDDNPSSKRYQQLVMSFADDVNSASFKRLTADRNEFEKMWGEETISETVKGTITKGLLSQLNTISPEQAKSIINSHTKGTEAKILDQSYRIYKAQLNKDMDEVSKASDKLSKLKGLTQTEADLLNTVSQYYLAHMEGEENLQKALNWSTKSVDVAPSLSNTYTLAKLYHQLGDEASARIYAQEAANMAGVLGIDTKEIAAFIESL